MAYGALASGLLGAMQGAGDQANDRIKAAAEKEKFDRELNAKEGSARRMLDMELETKDLYAQRVAERAKNQRSADMQTIETKANEDINASKTQQLKAEMAKQGIDASEMPDTAVQALRDNPAALKATLDSAKIKNGGILDVTASERGSAIEHAAQGINSTIFAEQHTINTEANATRALANKEAQTEIQQQRADNSSELIQAQIAALNKKVAGSGKEASTDTARIKNAKFLLENKIVTNAADAWERASELGDKNAETVLLGVAQDIKAAADKNFKKMSWAEAVTEAKGAVGAVKGMPAGGGLPAGASKQIGTSGGKPVYLMNDGSKKVAE